MLLKNYTTLLCAKKLTSLPLKKTRITNCSHTKTESPHMTMANVYNATKKHAPAVLNVAQYC